MRARFYDTGTRGDGQRLRPPAHSHAHNQLLSCRVGAARSRVLAEDHFPYVSAVYNAWTTAPRDVFGTVAATFTCDPGFGPDGSARLSLSAACVACASYDPPQFNDGGGFCEPCAQDCATTVVQTWQARLNARRTPDRVATVAWSTEPGAVPVTDLTKLDTCGGASAGTCMCPQGFFCTSKFHYCIASRRLRFPCRAPPVRLDNINPRLVFRMARKSLPSSRLARAPSTDYRLFETSVHAKKRLRFWTLTKSRISPFCSDLKGFLLDAPALVLFFSCQKWKQTVR